MKIKPSAIRYLLLAAGPRQLDEANILQIGETIPHVQTPFGLIEEWQNIRL